MSDINKRFRDDIRKMLDKAVTESHLPDAYFDHLQRHARSNLYKSFRARYPNAALRHFRAISIAVETVEGLIWKEYV